MQPNRSSPPTPSNQSQHPRQSSQAHKYQQLAMSRLKDLQTKLSQQQNSHDLLFDVFQTQAKFKQPGYESVEAKKKYFDKEFKKICFCCIFSQDTEYSDIGDFNLGFFNWLNQDNTKFPMLKKDVEDLFKSREQFLHQKRLEKIQALQNEKAKRERQQIEKLQKERKQNQKMIMERKRQERQKFERQQLQRQRQKQRQQQQQQQQQQQHEQRQQYTGKMVDESDQRRNLQRQNQHQSHQSRNISPPVSSISFQKMNRSPIPQIQNQNQNQIRYSEQPSTQVRGEPIYTKIEYSKEQLIKRALQKICQCHEFPEKRYRACSQARIQIDNLRRLEEAERANQRGYRNDRR